MISVAVPLADGTVIHVGPGEGEAVVSLELELDGGGALEVRTISLTRAEVSRLSRALAFVQEAGI